MRFISSGCANKDTVFVPAGAEASTGHHVGRGPEVLQPGYQGRRILAYAEFMKSRLPNVDLGNFAAGYGYMVAQALVVVLEQCKNDLSRANIMAQAANLKNVPLSMLLPGITLNTSPTDYRPIRDGYMVEFRDNQLNVISEMLRGS